MSPAATCLSESLTKSCLEAKAGELQVTLLHTPAFLAVGLAVEAIQTKRLHWINIISRAYGEKKVSGHRDERKNCL